MYNYIISSIQLSYALHTFTVTTHSSSDPFFDCPTFLPPSYQPSLLSHQVIITRGPLSFLPTLVLPTANNSSHRRLVVWDSRLVDKKLLGTKVKERKCMASREKGRCKLKGVTTGKHDWNLKRYQCISGCHLVTAAITATIAILTQ